MPDERFTNSARGTGDRPGPLLGSRGNASGSKVIWCVLDSTDHVFLFQITRHIPMKWDNNNNDFRLLYSAFMTVSSIAAEALYRNYPGHWDLPNLHYVCTYQAFTVCHFNVSLGRLPKGAATYSASQ